VVAALCAWPDRAVDEYRMARKECWHGRLQPIVLGEAKLLFQVKGEARWVEAQGPKGRERGGVLGNGAASSLPTS